MQTVTTNTLSDTMYYSEIPVFTYKINYPSFTTTCSDNAGKSINALMPNWRGRPRNTAEKNSTRRPQQMLNTPKAPGHFLFTRWMSFIRSLIIQDASSVYTQILIPMRAALTAKRCAPLTPGTLTQEKNCASQTSIPLPQPPCISFKIPWRNRRQKG